MPEGPEVRRYALQLADALEGSELVFVSARTQGAKKWLLEHPHTLVGKRVEKVWSHGKHLYGVFEGGFGFHSHLMMWGRWFVHPGNENIEVDRRERARLVTEKAIAVLFSAPVFELFEGDPYAQIENLRTLGPDILPAEGEFDRHEFGRRLRLDENLNREIGAVLLDQRVCAGIGNYLRADMLFFCGIDPWKTVSELDAQEFDYLCKQIPLIARRSLAQPGVSVPTEWRERLLNEPELSYSGRIVEWGARHAVFRRTNLPCLKCGNPIRQKQQTVYRTLDGDEENEPGNEKARTIFFCPHCQSVPVERFEKPKKTTRARRKTAVAEGTVDVIVSPDAN